MKKVAIVCGVVLGILMVVVLALEFFIDLSSYSPRITAPMEEALHRKVELGAISLSLLRGPGAKVQDISIFEPDESNLFVQVKAIVARVKLLPLISKKVEVAKIELNQPEVTIKRTKEGEWNFGDLLGTPVEASPQVPETPESSTQEPTPPATETPEEVSAETPTPAEQPASQASESGTSPMAQVAVDTFRLTGGLVRFVDETVNVTTELSNIRGDVDGIALESPIAFDVSADVDGGTQGKIKATGKVGPIPADGNIDNLDLDVTAQLEEIDLAHFGPYYQQQAMAMPEKLNANFKVNGNLGTLIASNGNLSVGDVKIDVSGTVEEPKTSPKLDLTIAMPQVPWEKVLELLPPAIAEAMKDLDLSGIGDIKIQPKGTLDNLVVSGEFDLSKSGIQFQQLFAKPEALKMTLTFETAIKPDVIDVSTLALTLGDFVLNVNGSVTNLAEPVLDFQVSTNDFPLDKLFALFPEFSQPAEEGKPVLTSGGTGMLTVSAKGALDDLAVQLALNLDQGQIGFGDLFHKDAQDAGNVNIDVHLGQETLTITQVLVQLGAFQLTTAGKVDTFRTEPQIDLTVDTNSFDIANLLAFLPVATASLPPELTLGGAGKLHVTSVGSPEDITISGFIDVTKGEIIFGETFTKPQDIPGKVEFDATMKEMDVVEIRKLLLNLNEVILDITGTVSDLKQEAKLDLKVKSNKFALNQLHPVAGMGIEPTGTTELDLAIKTSVANIDPASLVTGTLRLTDVGLSAPQLPKPVKHLNAQIAIDGDDVALQKFSASIGESSLNGEATLKELMAAPVIVFNLHAPKLNLDELMPPPADNAGKEAGDAGKEALRRSDVEGGTERLRSDNVIDLRVLLAQAAPVAPVLLVASNTEALIPASQLEFLQKLDVQGKLKVDQGQAKNVRFADLSADVNMDEGVATVENLLFSLYDGTYEGFVKLDLNDPDPKYEFQSELVHVDSNPMLADSTSINDVLYGFVFANLAIQGQGVTMEKVVQNLSGNGKFQFEDGKLTTLDLWSELAAIFQLLGSAGQVKELAKIGDDLSKFPDETHFSKLAGSFDLKDGSAGSSDLILEIPEQNMHVTMLLQGTFGLDTSLDFMGRIRFDPKSKYYKDIERNFRDFKQADGSIELPFPIPIGGTLLQPEVNRQSIQQSLTAFATEMAKQAVKNQVEKKVLELLQDKTSKDEPTPIPEAQQTQEPAPGVEPTPTPTPTPKPEELLEEVGKDLLKDLF